MKGVLVVAPINRLSLISLAGFVIRRLIKKEGARSPLRMLYLHGVSGAAVIGRS